MSDLQCAATLLICCAGDADDAGLTLPARGQARELGRSLGSARVSMVYSSSAPAAVQTAELAAAPSLVMVRVRDGLGSPSPEARHRVVEELQTIVDQHRGETVLVVSDAAAVRSVVPPLAKNLPDDYGDGHDAPPCSVTELAVDGDGWLVRSWAGRRV